MRFNTRHNGRVIPEVIRTVSELQEYLELPDDIFPNPVVDIKLLRLLQSTARLYVEKKEE